MQRKGLVGRSAGFNWKYVGYVQMGEDEAASDISASETYISGKVYSDDTSVDLLSVQEICAAIIMQCLIKI